MSRPEIPGFIKERLEKLSYKTGESVDSLINELYRLYNSDWIQTDPSFTTEEEKLIYAFRVLWVRKVSQPPTQEVTVIPIGYTETRISRAKGIPTSRIYVLRATDAGLQKTVIICRGNQADLWQEVQLFHAYKIHVSIDSRGVLHATPSTHVENPKPIPTDPKKLLVEHVGVKMFKLRDIHNYISRTVNIGGREIVDEWDLRGIQGIVLRYLTGTRPDGTTWGLYEISDDSVGEEDETTPEGKLIPSRLTVWTPKSMVKYDVDSEILVVGVVQLDKDDVPFMNAIAVIPIHARPIISG